MPRHQQLTAMQEKFAVAYASPNSSTYGNAKKSCILAGYSEKAAGVVGSQLAKTAHVAARISEIRKSNDAAELAQTQFTADWCRAEHWRLAKEAEASGNYAAATRNIELIGRTYGIYQDGVSVDIARVKEFSVTEAAEAKRLAALMITDSVAREVEAGNGVPALPAAPTGEASDAIASLIASQSATSEPIQTPPVAEIVDPGANGASVTELNNIGPNTTQDVADTALVE